ncbi:MAG: FAD-binding oxidoreductase [archaeon]|nr:FAD-binding oxidoreductase [archaeon]
MTLEKEILEEFEQVLGKENISDKKSITEIYAYNWSVDTLNVDRGNDPEFFSLPPIAVAMPSSTEEVQKIIKLCNKFNLRFKAQSTGMGPWNQVSRDNVIVVDLRRMNKIIKIDEKNMYAVVEPYVTGAQLQAELIKIGLNCHMPGAGPQVSPLASSTSMAGSGFTSSSTGYSGRNVLGVEWVMPTGKIIRLGSWGLKNNADWYTGDGPGPSLRGIMRGYVGAKSGLGIFCKVAIKLFPFPCDNKWKISGYSPDYEFEIPNYMKYVIIDYKSHEDLEMGMNRIAEEEICFALFHNSSFGVGVIFTNALHFIKGMIKSFLLKKPLVITITAHTKREFEYKMKRLSALIEETNGRDVSKLGLSGKLNPKSISYAELLRSLLGFHAFLAGMTFQSCQGGSDTFSMCVNMMKDNKPLKKVYSNKKKVVVNDGGEGVWSTSFEHGQYFHSEMPAFYEKTNEKSARGMAEYMHKTNELALTNHLGIPFFIIGDEMHEWFGPQCSNYHIWLRKIKEAFDPNNIADPGFYISSKLEKKK